MGPMVWFRIWTVPLVTVSGCIAGRAITLELLISPRDERPRVYLVRITASHHSLVTPTGQSGACKTGELRSL